MSRTRTTSTVALSVAIAMLLGTGCAGIATVKSEFDLPRQTLTEPIPEGMARVVFINGPKGGMEIDGSDKINISIEGRDLASLRKWQYVQVMLEPGTYEVKLVHLDIGRFSSGHVLDVEPGDNWVSAYSTITANKLVRLDRRPKDFPKRHKPAPMK